MPIIYTLFMFLLPIYEFQNTDRAWAIWTKTLLGPSHSGSLMNVSENAELRSDALLHFKTEDPEAEQADWMYTPGSPSFSKPFYLIIHLLFDVENDCLRFYAILHTIQSAISCNLSISHLTITTDSMISTLFPRLHTSSPFQGGQQCIPTSQGWSVNQQDIHVFRDGLRSNHRANPAGQIGTFPQGVKNTRKLKSPPRNPATFSIPLSARWIDQKT